MQHVHSAPSSRIETITDELHGHPISDPYRWLEDGGSPETASWVEAQNAHTRAILDGLPIRQTIHRRLSELLAVGTVSAPLSRHGRHFFTRREGRQNQPVLLLREDGSSEEHVLLDPNAASAEGLTALDWWYPSHDGGLLAFGYSSHGDEWSTLHVLDVTSGALLSDRIERTRYASIAWLPDGSGFYYTRYPASGAVPAGEENYGRMVYFHHLGDDSADDPLIFGQGLRPDEMVGVDISAGGRRLLISIYQGPGRSELQLLDLTVAGAQPVPLAVGYDALFSAEFAGDMLYIHTNLDASRYRVFRTPVDSPRRETWREVIPEAPDAVLESVTLSGGWLLCGYLRNAISELTLFDQDGVRVRDVTLPGPGTLTAISGEWDTAGAFYSFESFTTAPTVYRLSGSEAGTSRWAEVDVAQRPEDFAVSQEWYSSRDGTAVSMFIVHRAGLDLTLPHKTVLTGYGGFNLSRTPAFERSIYPWLESGGIYALPNLRGGGEYGEEWHRAGCLDRKQNVFDDFIAAAEHLIAQGYTEPSKLAISGRSNGGLLVGAALTQRPELFHAVVCGVPLLDMLRYHHFLIARLWVPEYGSADDPDQFAYLHAYSPYHQVRGGVCYPATLLHTAESDSRVDPLHARKMTALLQKATSCDQPILLRTESQAGHGIGKPLIRIIDEQTDIWTFIFWQLQNMPE